LWGQLFGIGEVVWDTPCAGDSTVTLRSILASPLPRKILWDCRLDGDACRGREAGREAGGEGREREGRERCGQAGPVSSLVHGDTSTRRHISLSCQPFLLLSMRHFLRGGPGRNANVSVCLAPVLCPPCVCGRLDSYTLWHHHGVILEHLDDLQVAIAHTMPAAEYLYVRLCAWGRVRVPFVVAASAS
jgi:hypothetical protein